VTGPQIPAQTPARQKALLNFPSLETVRQWLSCRRETLLCIGEVLLIFAWTLYVGSAYLNFNPQVWPNGAEYPSAVNANYTWTLLPKCGTCVFWNGFLGGGAPTFSDIFSNSLHPLVFGATLVWGVVNGSKVILLLSFFIAGFAQWWLTRVMGLGRIARLFCGGMAVVGGHLAARMEIGAVVMVFSTACCSLVLAPAVGLGLTGKRRYAILLALALASALLSGQGYIQIGLALSVLPALLIFMVDRQFRLLPVWKEYLLAGGLAILLAGVLLVPLIHFYPNVWKESDPSFTTAQNISYIPLNQVIDNKAFYYSNILKNVPYPSLYADYIGWVPVLLAILSLRFIPRSRRRLLAYLLAALGLVYLASSALPLKGLASLFPSMTGVRFSPILLGLANPVLLGLTAWGLDGLIHLKWPVIGFFDESQSRQFPGWAFNTAILVLVVPLFWSLKSAYDFGHSWLGATRIDPSIYAVPQALVTDTSEWVNLPYGEHYWAIPAFDTGLKLSNGVRPWKWINHDFAPAFREGTRSEVDPTSPNYIASVGGINLVAHPENEYAYIAVGNLITPCQAHALGGNIDVDCPVAGPGQLVVHEYYYTGWTAWRDGVRTPMLDSKWLSAEAPAGQHKFAFRYRPWDVWAGLFLSLSGLAACTVLWRKSAS